MRSPFGLFFQQHGLKVTVTDLSPGMVARCREKGLDAYVMDFLNLDFPASTFDAVFAMNCLLHVPKVDLSQVLSKIHALLKPGALFFLGQHGGYDWEGSWEGDHYEPKRHYVFWSDEALRAQLEPLFDVLRFEGIPHEDGDGKIYFQAFFLRKPPA